MGAQKNRWDNGSDYIAAQETVEDQKPETTEREKLTGKSRWENFWFYYKKHTIIGAIILVLLVVLVSESVNREQYDLTVILATKGTTITEQEDRIAELLSQYIEDYNGDGKVNVYVDVQNLPLDDAETSSEVFTAMQTRFAGEMAVGEKSIYIMDQTLYDYYELDGVFIDLSEKYPNAEGVDGDRFYLNDLFAGEPLLSEYMPECFVLQRRPENMSGYKKDKIKAEYERESGFIDNLVNGRLLTPIERADGESSGVSGIS